MEASAEVLAIWDKFCSGFKITDTCVPLFEVDNDGNVKTKKIGKTLRRTVLQRSQRMESMIVEIARQLIDDYTNHNDNPDMERAFDGMLYMMGWKEEGRFLPLYVGKTETLGRKDDGGLSRNIRGIPTSQSRTIFARWGDNYQYHIGDLSACVLEDHAEDKRQRRYQRWAKTLFRDEGKSLKLKKDTYFWATPWRPAKTSVWEELGPTTLAVSEYLLIGVAGKINPDDFLNRDGVPR